MPNQSTDYLPYLFLAAMIVIGGLVALVADGMGRKIGKKRLSFLGLRPRHTATLITVAAGVLIPILTIAAIYGLSREVRDWIREGRGAIKRATDAQALADSKEKENDKLEALQKQLQDSNKHLTSEAKKLTEQVAANKQAATLAGEQLKVAQGQVQIAQRKVASLEPALRKTEGLIQEKTKEVLAKQKEVEKGRKALASLQGNLNSATNQTNETSRRNNELERRQQALERDLKDAEKGLENLQSQKKAYETEIDTYKDSIETYKSSVEQYSTKISELEQEYDKLRSNAMTSVLASRTRPMIFEASEELARIQLPPSLSPASARLAFLDLLQRARTAALAKKAMNSPASPPAGLWLREVNKRMVSIAEQEDAIVRGITAQRPELVFTARTVANAFEGEFIPLEFVAYRNKLVYRENRLITEKRIDGRKSDVEVLRQIQDFLGTNVRNQALKDGMIPPSGPSGKLGAITEEELFELIREVRSHNQLVRIQALAKSDTNAGDQLDILFRVRL